MIYASTARLLILVLFAVQLSTAAFLRAQNAFPFTTDFSDGAFPEQAGPWTWNDSRKILELRQPSGSGVVVARTATEVTGVSGNSFVISSWMTVVDVQGSGTAITAGFGAFANNSAFSGTYYLADWTVRGSGAGNVRILSLGGAGGGFAAVNGNAGVPEPGETYELRLTGTYDGATLSLEFRVFDASGSPVGTAATAVDTAPLTGTYFGYRNRTAHASHLLELDYHAFGVSTEPLPYPDTAPLPHYLSFDDITPPPGTHRHPAAAGLSLTVSTDESRTLAAEDIEVYIDGVLVPPEELTVAGASPSYQVSYDGLQSNRLYKVRVVASDNATSGEVAWTFDTFDGSLAAGTLDDVELNMSSDDALHGIIGSGNFAPVEGSLVALTDASSAAAPAANVIPGPDNEIVEIVWDLGDPNNAQHRSLDRIDIWITGADPWRTGYDGEFAVSTDGIHFTVIEGSRFATPLTYTGAPVPGIPATDTGTGTGNYNLVRLVFPAGAVSDFRYLKFISRGFDNLGEFTEEGAMLLRQPRFVEVDAFVTESGPVIANLTPLHDAFFYPAEDGLRFQVSTEEPNTLSTEDIELYLNGELISHQSLTITGSSPAYEVFFDGLEPNEFYAVTVIARDNERQTTHHWSFDTLNEDAVVVIEAEDYNFAAGMLCDGDSGAVSGTPGGGSYIDRPTPSTFTNGSYFNQATGYVDRVGEPGVDFFSKSETKATLETNMYRWCDVVGTFFSGDLPPRPKYDEASLNAGVTIPDYDLHLVETGEWFNYTRNFPEGQYQVFLRAAATGAPVILLERVTSDPTQPNQQTEVLGEFRPEGNGVYQFTRLTGPDGLDQEVRVALSGEETVRLRAVSANNFNNDIQINFFMFIPVDETLPTVVSTTPVHHSGNVDRNVTIEAEVVNGTVALDVLSLRLFVNEDEVSAITAATGNGATIYFTPGNLPAGINRARVEYFDSEGSGPYSVAWSFSVLPGNLQRFFALEFDGIDDFVSFSHAGGTFGDFTISAWYKILDQEEQQVLFRMTNQESLTRTIEMRELDGIITAGIRVVSGGDLHTVSTSDFEYGEWVHIALVRDADQLLLYLNGELKSSLTVPTTEIVVMRRSFIGADPYPWAQLGAQFFRGAVDEFQIWHVAKTQQEISESMFEPLHDLLNPADGLHLRFGFNEGGGAVATDFSSGNGFLGELWGGTWIDSEIFESAVLPVLAISRDGAGVILNWEGAEAILESAPEVTGPWTVVDGAASPYSVDTTEVSRQFFRLSIE